MLSPYQSYHPVSVRQEKPFGRKVIVGLFGVLFWKVRKKITKNTTL